MDQQNGNNKKYGMVIDLDKCTGCGACMVACMAENNVPFREDDTDKLLSVSWMRVYRLGNGKPFPQVEECYLPRPCQHCEGHLGHSPCVSVCPATATDYDMHTGIVSQIPTRCFGCRYCMACLPLPCASVQLVGPDLAGRHGADAQPQRLRAHARHRREVQLLLSPLPAGQRQGLRRGSARTGGGRIPDRLHPGLPGGRHPLRRPEQPAHAVHQIAQPDPAHERRSRNPKAFRLLERLGTNPKMYYLSSKEWVRKAGDNRGATHRESEKA